MSEQIALDKIKLDGGTQSRAGLNTRTVSQYAALMADNVKFPPIVIFREGENDWLADGFHRVAAAKKAGLLTISADIQIGSKRDALLHSVGANSRHGLQRTNADKRRAVTILISDEEWAKWSDREIARQCGVSGHFVSSMRAEMGIETHDGKRTVRRGAAIYKQKFTKTGQARKKKAVQSKYGHLPWRIADYFNPLIVDGQNNLIALFDDPKTAIRVVRLVNEQEKSK